MPAVGCQATVEGRSGWEGGKSVTSGGSMIDWVHAEAERWGRQMRWKWLGKDGWPSRTMLGKLIDEGVVGASSAKFMQFFPEHLTSDALAVNRVVQALAEGDRAMFFVHYIVIGKGKTKAHRMGVPVRTYYDHLDRAHKAYASAQHRLHKITPIRATRNDEDRLAFPIPLAHTA
jgi:hypothetical protein